MSDALGRDAMGGLCNTEPYVVGGEVYDPTKLGEGYGVEVDPSLSVYENAMRILDTISANKAILWHAYREPLGRILRQRYIELSEVFEESDVDELLDEVYNHDIWIAKQRLPEEVLTSWAKMAIERITKIRRTNDLLIYEVRSILTNQGHDSLGNLPAFPADQAIVLYGRILEVINGLQNEAIDEILQRADADLSILTSQKGYFLKPTDGGGSVYYVPSITEPALYITPDRRLYIVIEAEAVGQKIDNIPIELGSGVEIATAEDLIFDLENTFTEERILANDFSDIEYYMFAAKKLDVPQRYIEDTEDENTKQLLNTKWHELEKAYCRAFMQLADAVYSQDNPEIRDRFNALLEITVQRLGVGQVGMLGTIISESIERDPTQIALAHVRDESARRECIRREATAARIDAEYPEWDIRF